MSRTSNFQPSIVLCDCAGAAVCGEPSQIVSHCPSYRGPQARSACRTPGLDATERDLTPLPSSKLLSEERSPYDVAPQAGGRLSIARCRGGLGLTASEARTAALPEPLGLYVCILYSTRMAHLDTAIDSPQQYCRPPRETHSLNRTNPSVLELCTLAIAAEIDDSELLATRSVELGSDAAAPLVASWAYVAPCETSFICG
ncbi:hypothetical protein K466DRAFT_149026 [Polyporus arcularius HHB13444]|uniref:Uncharacterized protein n=1 Tax=Polyporus arcularius HHB13444 TaxID=1314778 RepID=A0A5C3PA09_9APHY|nr:hypothetical protein K466DRAFT_149026 [Polyporus arcularius HHB13444]